MRILALLALAPSDTKVLILALVLFVASPVCGQSFEISEKAANAPGNVLPVLETNNLAEDEHVTKTIDLEHWVERLKCRERRKGPPPPKLPRNFRWKGRYIVPDLVDPATGKVGVNVPFTWQGRNGNIQMIAGGEEYPIHFTNLIYNGCLYTYTYKWPCLQPEFLPPLEPCHPLLKFTLEDLNAFFATSVYVGAEILKEESPRHVHHFRVGIVLPIFPPGFYPRLPILSADIYVDRKNPSKFWKVLHFGLQNIYDPALDEWIVINKFEDCPGEITLPPVCTKCPCEDKTKG